MTQSIDAHSNATILVGAQWGDEGKGKWVDILAEGATVSARYQGGNNAGHTLYVDGKKIVLHQIPSGIFQPGHLCALCAGVVINPVEMVAEIKKVSEIVAVNPERLLLSARAHVITPWHVYLDTRNESQTDKPIGTTKRGIGPTYSQKAQRTGLRFGDYCQQFRLKSWIDQRLKDPEFAEFYNQNPELWQRFVEASNILRPYLCDAEATLRQHLKRGDHLLLEGAQGALLDLNHGTYPYVTSSSTGTGGAFTGLGFAPKHIKQIFGIAKAYCTRVGEGPFPTELQDSDGEKLAKVGAEFGATTGRARRCGWLDLVALRYAIDVCGIDRLIVNKLDVLSEFEEVKICVAYHHPDKGRIDQFPWDGETLEGVQPEYITLPGWNQTLPKEAQQLPQQVKDFISAIEEQVGVPVAFIGTGPGRGDYIRHGSGRSAGSDYLT